MRYHYSQLEKNFQHLTHPKLKKLSLKRNYKLLHSVGCYAQGLQEIMVYDDAVITSLLVAFK